MIFRCRVCEKEFVAFKNRQCCSDTCRRTFDETRYVVKRKLTSVEASYIAGLVDGEGTISIWKERRPKNIVGWRHKTTFTISQSNRPFLEEIQAVIGNGAIRQSTGHSANWKHKKNYILSFNSIQTRWVLPQIRPYLKLKGRQADLVLTAFEFLDLGRRANTHSVREELYQECHKLNQRGVLLDVPCTPEGPGVMRTSTET